MQVPADLWPAAVLPGRPCHGQCLPAVRRPEQVRNMTPESGLVTAQQERLRSHARRGRVEVGQHDPSVRRPRARYRTITPSTPHPVITSHNRIVVRTASDTLSATSAQSQQNFVNETATKNSGESEKYGENLHDDSQAPGVGRANPTKSWLFIGSSRTVSPAWGASIIIPLLVRMPTWPGAVMVSPGVAWPLHEVGEHNPFRRFATVLRACGTRSW